MNKVFSTVWSDARRCYVVASEFGARRKSSRSKAILGMVSAVAVCGASLPAHADLTRLIRKRLRRRVSPRSPPFRRPAPAEVKARGEGTVATR